MRRMRCHQLQHGTPLPHAPGAMMTVVTKNSFKLQAQFQINLCAAPGSDDVHTKHTRHTKHTSHTKHTAPLFAPSNSQHVQNHTISQNIKFAQNRSLCGPRQNVAAHRNLHVQLFCDTVFEHHHLLAQNNHMCVQQLCCCICAHPRLFAPII